jgi:hypothetical protein
MTMKNSRTISRRGLLCSLVAVPALVIISAGPQVLAADSSDPVAVVELFTSQGCSSCPPADKFLGTLQNQPNVISLSFSVDYWDYLGWKDTLGSPENSRRQKEYAAYRGDGRVYTPQMVVNGQRHFVGSSKGKVKAEIGQQLSRPANDFVPLKFAYTKTELSISVGEAKSAAQRKDATVWLMLVSREVKQKILKGENRGKSITYHNVVQRTIPVGMWHGDATTINLPMSELMPKGVDDCVVLLQEAGNGPILGAGIVRGDEHSESH